MSSAITPTGTSGVYSMGGQNYDLETLLMAIGEERANLIEKQMVDQASAMKDRNDKIKVLNEIMTSIRAKGTEAGAEHDFNAKTSMVTVPDGQGGTKQQSAWDFLASTGVDPSKIDDGGAGVGSWGKDERENALNSIKGQLDSMNSDSQMDMIRLQGLVNKRDQAFEMITNLISKFAKTTDAIVGNLR